MFKKGFKFYIGMLTASLSVVGGFIALMKFSKTAREKLLSWYMNFVRTIAEHFDKSLEE